MKTTKAIYEPKGAALEYSPLAANLYKGCAHGCWYCYGPAATHRARADFLRAAPRPGILDALRKDVEVFARNVRPMPLGYLGPVLLCFSCDPYQPLEYELKITQQAIAILGEARMGIRVLTKNPAFAIDRDLELFRRFDVEFGTTLLFTKERDRLRWEPWASPVHDRITAMQTAHRCGLKTWLSIEPVIDPKQAIGVIGKLAGAVDVFKVGKLNHDRRRENTIDWRQFLEAALNTLDYVGAGWFIKDALWRYADADIRRTWPKARTQPAKPDKVPAG